MSDFKPLLPNIKGLIDPKVETQLYRAFLSVYEYFTKELANNKEEFTKKILLATDESSRNLNDLIGIFSQPLAGSEVVDPLLQSVLQTFGPQDANKVFAGPVPSFRLLTIADIPALIAAQLDADGTILDINAIAANEFLRRVGTTIVGVALAASHISDFNEAAQDAVGGILSDNLSYNDGAGVIDTIQGIKTTSTPTFTRLTLIGTAGNVLVVDTNVLVVDASNNRVGIGNAAPLKTLHVGEGTDVPGTTVDGIYLAKDGNVAFAIRDCTNDIEYQFTIANVVFAGVIMGTVTNHPFMIRTNAVERIRFDTAGNAKLAGSAVRGTTEGTNHLDIFNGTAPVGTLTNGISLYNTAGELRVMDSGGTATLLSQHSQDAPDWFYDDEKFPADVSMETNCFAGIVRFTNHTRTAKLQQALFNGETLPSNPLKRKIFHEETFDDYNKRLKLVPADEKFLLVITWEEDQENHFKHREKEIKEWEDKLVKNNEELALFAQKLANLDETEIEARRDLERDRPIKFDQSRPEKYIKQPKPSWLKK